MLPMCMSACAYASACMHGCMRRVRLEAPGSGYHPADRCCTASQAARHAVNAPCMWTCGSGMVLECSVRFISHVLCWLQFALLGVCQMFGMQQNGSSSHHLTYCTWQRRPQSPLFFLMHWRGGNTAPACCCCCCCNRLDMGKKLKNPLGADLYAYWSERVAEQLNK
jgi:hypothetical protein